MKRLISCSLAAAALLTSPVFFTDAAAASVQNAKSAVSSRQLNEESAVQKDRILIDVRRESETSDAADSTSDASDDAPLLGSFSTTDLDGNPVDQTVFEDYDLTMINVWATYCGPCLNEMPDLGELAAEYQDKQVQIIGFVTDVLNSDGSLSESQLETAGDVVLATSADYMHIVPSPDLFSLLGAISSVPTTFFVDSNGALTGYVYVGAHEKEDWAAIIDETLEELSK